MSRNRPPRPRALTFAEQSRARALGVELAPPVELAEPVTSSDLDTREAPTCACGAPVYADGLCVRCHENAFDAKRAARRESCE